MADTLKNKVQVQASQNSGAMVSDTVGASEVDTILSVSICNTDASNDTTINMYIDDATSADKHIYFNQPLPAKSTFIHGSKIVLKENDVLKFLTTEAVSCQVVTSYLHQTSVSTSSDYLNSIFVYQTGSSAEVNMTPLNVAETITVLSFTVCNITTTDTTFDVFVRSGGSEYRILKDQALPAKSTYEHNDKIILEAQGELVFDQAGSVNVGIACSFLRQP